MSYYFTKDDLKKSVIQSIIVAIIMWLTFGSKLFEIGYNIGSKKKG